VGEVEEYFRNLERKVLELYSLAKRARGKSFEPANEPEVILARDLAERVEGLLKQYGISGIANRIRELSKSFSRELVALKIAEEIVYGKYGNFSDEKAIEIAVRAALAILTEGITAAPVQGIEKVKIKANSDGTKYVAIYYAGPIRSAGGTEQALTVLVADYVRRLLHLDRYKPTDEEVKRMIEEIRLHERYVGRFQYHNSDEVLEKALKRVPVEITGVPTAQIEVSIHRDLPRVETNKIRGGACRVINDGLLGKAPKIMKIAEEVGLAGWEWLGEIARKGSESKEVSPSDKYLADIIAGRPVFAHPSRVGGFRLRYGRSRNTGLAAVGLHPATMFMLEEFLAVGTQIRIERPGKSAIVMPVDSIEGPIVKLKDGSVIQVNSMDEAVKLREKVEEILFLGDILIAYGEFLENNHPLLPSGYVEEWWIKDLIKAIEERGLTIEEAGRVLNIDAERLNSLIHAWWECKPTAQEALTISTQLGVPLHPKYTYHWSEISAGEVQLLKNWLKNVTIRSSSTAEVIVKVSSEIKKILEKLCIPHRVVSNNEVILDKQHIDVLSACLAGEHEDLLKAENGLEAVNMISRVKIMSKAPTFIGLRMGRPEKARERKMKPPVHVLFPVGLDGGKSRNIVEAASKRYIKVAISYRKCLKCGRSTFYVKCPYCGSKTIEIRICPKCRSEIVGDKCEKCGVRVQKVKERLVDLAGELRRACKRLNIQVVPETVKGVKGLVNSSKIPEPIEKGILRAKYGVFVYKDGTCRFDVTNAPLTHFKPKEIGVNIDKLKELGYLRDYRGRELVSEDQIVELKIQDVIIPLEAARYLVKVAKYVDELLVRFYNEEPYYRIRDVNDLLGHLIIGIAPHTSAGVIGRIIGFTKAKVCYAHPYWHAAKRRNCDGDEDAIILALDAFLNFSRTYLPEKRGGLMDTPIIVMIKVDPGEVDDEVFNMEICREYPIELYLYSQKYYDPKKLHNKIDIIEGRLGTELKYFNFGFTHPTSSISSGPLRTMYKKLKSMEDKIEAQMRIAEKIKAVDEKDVAERIVVHHFLPDLIGNLRAFSTQSFRCVKCNAKYERPPLTGKCRRCGGKVVLTVHKRSIEKYLSSALHLIKKYNLGRYYEQRIDLIRKELDLLFCEERREGQVKLTEYFRGKESQ